MSVLLGLYVVPAASHPLYRSGTAVLGFDVRAQRHHETRWAPLNRRAARYGLHLTVGDLTASHAPTVRSSIQHALARHCAPAPLLEPLAEPWTRWGPWVAIRYTAPPALARLREALSAHFVPRRAAWTPHVSLLSEVPPRQDPLPSLRAQVQPASIPVRSLCLVALGDGGVEIVQEWPWPG